MSRGETEAERLRAINKVLAREYGTLPSLIPTESLREVERRLVAKDIVTKQDFRKIAQPDAPAENTFTSRLLTTVLRAIQLDVDAFEKFLDVLFLYQPFDRLAEEICQQMKQEGFPEYMELVPSTMQSSKGASRSSILEDLFRAHYYPLCKALAHQPRLIVPLSDRLCASGLIDHETRTVVQKFTQLSPDERASKLLSPAIQRAQESVKEAQRFCQCLYECGIPVPEGILREVEGQAMVSEAQVTQGGPAIRSEFLRAHPPMYLGSIQDKPVSLQGVVECGETVLKVVGDKEQKLSWTKYGFGVTVPEGANSKDVTVYLRVKAILSGQFKLPNDTHLVSAIYWVSSTHAFAKEVSVDLSHCASIASEKEAADYKFIIGKSSQQTLPYTFKITNGVFSPHSQIATISLKEFCFLAAIFCGWRAPRNKYTLHYYLTEVKPSMEWMASFFVTRHLPAMKQAVENVCPRPWIHRLHQILEFKEEEGQQRRWWDVGTGKNEKQSVEVSITTATDGEEENWEIFHETSKEILRKHVDDYQKDMDHTLPCCKIRISWEGEGDQERRARFQRHVDLNGAKPPNNEIGIYISRPSSTSTAHASSEEQTSNLRSRTGPTAEHQSSNDNQVKPSTALKGNLQIPTPCGPIIIPIDLLNRHTWLTRLGMVIFVIALAFAAWKHYF